MFDHIGVGVSDLKASKAYAGFNAGCSKPYRCIPSLRPITLPTNSGLRTRKHTSVADSFENPSDNGEAL